MENLELCECGHFKHQHGQPFNSQNSTIDLKLQCNLCNCEKYRYKRNTTLANYRKF